MLVGQGRVLCIAAVESAPHLTHDGNNRLVRRRLGLNVCSTCPTHSIARVRRNNWARFTGGRDARLNPDFMLSRPDFLCVSLCAFTFPRLLSLGGAARLRRSPLFVRFAPRFKGGEDGGEAHAQLREGVFDPGRDLSVDGSRNQSAIGHCAQI